MRTIAQFSRTISSQLRHVSTIGKKLVNSNIFSSCSSNMVIFGLLTADIGSLVWGTPANFNEFRVLASLLQRRCSPEANQTLQNVWPSPGLVLYIYIFGAFAPWRDFARCKVHSASKSCVLVYWQRYCTALQQRPLAKLRRGTRNEITEVSQRAPPTFGWAAITFGIGPDSSFSIFRKAAELC